MQFDSQAGEVERIIDDGLAAAKRLAGGGLEGEALDSAIRGGQVLEVAGLAAPFERATLVERLANGDAALHDTRQAGGAI